MGLSLVLLDKCDIVILDCDGVIFDSNVLKVEAFKKVLTEYDHTLVESFLEYFKNNFGTSRYSLARVFLEEFVEVKFDEHIYRGILSRFGDQCVRLYSEASYTPSFLKFLEKYKNKDLFVASGSDEAELRKIFQQKQIGKYFKSIGGSPTKKTELVKAICDENYDKSIVMIGDAKSDFSACQDNNIAFVFMKQFSMSQEMLSDTDLNSIFNLGDLV